MANEKKKRPPVLLIHKKSCNRPDVKEAVRAFQQQGGKIKVIIPWSRKDMKRAVRREIRKGTRRVIAGGGDGTLNDVISILMKHHRNDDVTLGVFPLGTANDFARGAGIPSNDLKAALKLAAIGDPTIIDVGRMNDEYFLNVASGGFGSEITASTPQKLKKALGGVAYTLMGIAKLSDLKPYRCSVHIAGETAVETTMLVMAVGNNRFAGGGFDVAPKANVKDGLLDIAVLASFEKSEIEHITRELADPFNAENKFLFYRQAADFTIESNRPLHINLDGEPHIGTKFTFEIVPSAISVVLGPA